MAVLDRVNILGFSCVWSSAQFRLSAERVPRGFRRKQMDIAVGREFGFSLVELSGW